jgi:hypothetical protein
MGYYKENIWTRKKIRKRVKKKKQRDKGYITKDRYCKIYKSSPTKTEWAC